MSWFQVSQIRYTSCIVSACVHYSAHRDRTGSTLGSRIGFPTLREPIFNLFLPYPCFRSIFQVFLKQALVVCEQQQVHLALSPVVYTHLVASLHLVALVYSLFFLCFCPLVRPKLLFLGIAFIKRDLPLLSSNFDHTTHFYSLILPPFTSPQNEW